MPYTPILGTLGYVIDRTADKVLMIHRNARAHDDHFGKYNGLGGKLERDEDIVSGMQREIREEAGIEVTHMCLCGSINWPGFGKNGEDWLGFVFLIDGWTGEPLMRNNEGTLEWVAVARILAACSDDAATRAAAALPLWPGDKYFLPLVFAAQRSAAQPKQFHAHMPYANGQPVGWSFQALGD
jgi:8-oxo-dGTP diphosphatase